MIPPSADLFTDKSYAGRLDGTTRLLAPVTLQQQALATTDLEHVIGLYDGVADPLEQTNLIDDHPEVASELKALLVEKFLRIDEGQKPVMVGEETLEKLRALGYVP